MTKSSNKKLDKNVKNFESNKTKAIKTFLIFLCSSIVAGWIAYIIFAYATTTYYIEHETSDKTIEYPSNILDIAEIKINNQVVKNISYKEIKIYNRNLKSFNNFQINIDLPKKNVIHQVILYNDSYSSKYIRWLEDKKSYVIEADLLNSTGSQNPNFTIRFFYFSKEDIPKDFTLTTNTSGIEFVKFREFSLFVFENMLAVTILLFMLGVPFWFLRNFLKIRKVQMSVCYIRILNNLLIKLFRSDYKISEKNLILIALYTHNIIYNRWFWFEKNDPDIDLSSLELEVNDDEVDLSENEKKEKVD